MVDFQTFENFSLGDAALPGPPDPDGIHQGEQIVEGAIVASREGNAPIKRFNQLLKTCCRLGLTERHLSQAAR